ncbi:hypothetical protein LTS18_004742 [Coniosporium uncinatum]|uniref:Uncharacterized protein n=1 Tax=Coniosporium uncinatum TaxID=93489 RepID=A0ACC3DS77_9PEZI|nr:hypothetical protein LTS18_004742 [Coniosporium uncinatum]
MRTPTPSTLRWLRAAITDAPPSPRRLPRACAYHTATASSRLSHRMTPPRASRTPLHSRALATAADSTSSHSAAPTSPSTKPTHYGLFPLTFPSGPPPASPFTIDPRALRNEFLQLQAKTHPDKFPQAQKRQAEGASALINEAYRTLLDPLRRAQYLLSLQGIDVEDEASKMGGGVGGMAGGEQDIEFLQEVMEVNEAVEECETEDDVWALGSVNEKRIEGSVGELERAFAEEDLEGAKRECVRLRYWVNLRETLRAWEKGKPVVLQH